MNQYRIIKLQDQWTLIILASDASTVLHVFVCQRYVDAILMVQQIGLELSQNDQLLKVS